MAAKAIIVAGIFLLILAGMLLAYQRWRVERKVELEKEKERTKQKEAEAQAELFEDENL